MQKVAIRMVAKMRHTITILPSSVIGSGAHRPPGAGPGPTHISRNGLFWHGGPAPYCSGPGLCRWIGGVDMSMVARMARFQNTVPPSGAGYLTLDLRHDEPLSDDVGAEVDQKGSSPSLYVAGTATPAGGGEPSQPAAILSASRICSRVMCNMGPNRCLM